MSVDVILPIYKPDNNIFKAIDSVINQTYDNWILHIVDDASGDNSLEVIKNKYGNLKGKVKYYQLEKNRRQAYARNYAIKRGNGKYIAFIDQDDVWVPEKLEWQVAYIEKQGVDAVHGNLMMIDNDDNIINKEKWEKENEGRCKIDWKTIGNKELAKKIFLKPNIRIISSMVTHQIFEKIGGFKDQFFGGEDEIFWFEIAYYGNIGHLDKVLFYRREHEFNAFELYKSERYRGYLSGIKYLKKNYHNTVCELYREKEQGLLRSLTKSLIRNKNYFVGLKWIIILIIKYPKTTIKKGLHLLNNLKINFL